MRFYVNWTRASIRILINALIQIEREANKLLFTTGSVIIVNTNLDFVSDINIITFFPYNMFPFMMTLTLETESELNI
jgi:hypothetical protein